MKIIRLRVENKDTGCVTDAAAPRISFAVSSERQGAILKKARISLNGWEGTTDRQILVPYGGKPLLPFEEYAVAVEAEDNFGESDRTETTFETGRLSLPWEGKWISDPAYRFTKKRVSPVPMTFQKVWRAE